MAGRGRPRSAGRLRAPPDDHRHFGECVESEPLVAELPQRNGDAVTVLARKNVGEPVAEVAVAPAGGDLETVILIDRSRVAAHEDSQSAVGRQSLGDCRLDARGVGPAYELLEKRNADAPPLVAGIAGVAAGQLADVVAEDADRAGGKARCPVVEVHPVQRVPDAVGASLPPDVLPELQSKARIALAPRSAIRLRTSASGPWQSMGTLPRSDIVIGR